MPAAAVLALAGCATEPVVHVHTPATVATPAAVAVAPAVTMMGATSGTFTAIDRDFALTAANNNLLEMAAAEMAQRRTSSPDILSYASMLHQHHSAAMAELSALMRARGMGVPSVVPTTLQPIMNRLGTTRGGDFDRQFVTTIGLEAHASALATFQQQMPALSDPQLRAWAAKTLPVLQQHYAMAQQLAARVG